ncbi:MAG UNVERIFIED_CONTAM: hypothetical protein LVR29_16890 [Microcystis novacekii LVE1205-3]|jgi:ribosome biogenesis protein ERB1
MVTKTKASMTAGKRGAENIPELNPASEEEESVYDSDAYDDEDESEEDEGSDEEQDDDDDDDEEEFEDQGSSDEDDDVLDTQKADDDSSEGDVEILDEIEDYEAPRAWKKQPLKRNVLGSTKEKPTAEATWIHTDDLSSDDEDEEGVTNRIGRVPLHWDDEYDHIGYDAHGSKVVKSTGKGDRLDQAIAGVDGVKRFVVHDALNDKEVELSERRLELIRRVQAGAFAHPRV